MNRLKHHLTTIQDGTLELPLINLAGLAHQSRIKKASAAIKSSESQLGKHERENQAQNDSHSKIVANDQYCCDPKPTLTAITVSLFESDPSIHKMHLMWVKQTHQGTANNYMIEFRQPP